MPSIEVIQPKINRGYGVAGRVLGQKFNVYRLGPNSSGSVVQSSNLIASNVRVMIAKHNGHVDVEANYFIHVPLFRGRFDPTHYQIGDVFVEAGGQTYTDGSAFTYAYFRPLRAFLLVHTPIASTITRTNANPQNVSNGRAPFSGMNKGTERYLVLQNGAYSFQSTGTPAMVYCGLQATNKQAELPSPDKRLPTDVPRQHWHVYTPLLPGIVLQESDIVNGATGDRYFVSVPFVQAVGLHGWQLLCHKLRV